jgi:hypothetical protein
VLLGADLDNYLNAYDFPEIYLQKIEYGSPTTEQFEGAVRGLSGLAHLIERLVYFKQAAKIKEMEIKEKELFLLNLKITSLDQFFLFLFWFY